METDDSTELENDIIDFIRSREEPPHEISNALFNECAKVYLSIHANHHDRHFVYTQYFDFHKEFYEYWLDKLSLFVDKDNPES